MTDMTVPIALNIDERDLATDPLVYVGVWRRLGAFLIDLTIVGLLGWLLCFVLAAILFACIDCNSAKGTDNGFYVDWFVQIISWAWAWLYFAIQESSRYQATVGKRMLKIKVIGRSGNRLSFANASGRYFAKILSDKMTLMLGYLIADCTKRKQALHDMIAGTFVVERV